MPRRAQVLGACWLLWLLAHLVLAQLALLAVAGLYLIARAARLPASWLVVPAAFSLLWALVTGPVDAVAGLVRGPLEVLGYFGGVAGDPARLRDPAAAWAGWAGWLPGQLPLAIAVGAAEAAFFVWLDWLHTDEWRVGHRHPSPLVLLRRAGSGLAVRRGAVLTKDGVAVGVVRRTGERAVLTWRELAEGVLTVGMSRTGVSTTSFQLVYGALRRRKPVVAVDLSGSDEIRRRFLDACRATGIPAQVIGPGEAAVYEPLRRGDPAHRAELVLGMVDWAGIAEQHRRTARAYLRELFAVLDAAPGDPRTPVLAEVAHLLGPAALRARAEVIPAHHPHRKRLLERVKVCVKVIEADARPLPTVAARLRELLGSELGPSLRPDPGRLAEGEAGDGGVDLERLIVRRGAVLFSLDTSAHGRAAASLAGLVVHDLLARCAELREMGIGGDALVWIDRCDELPAEPLAELVNRGVRDGVAPVFTTSDDRAEVGSTLDRFGERMGTVLIHRMTDSDAAFRLARLAGERRGTVAAPEVAESAAYSAGLDEPGEGPSHDRVLAVTPAEIQELDDYTFVMAVKRPRRRMLADVLAVPPRLGHAAAPADTGTEAAEPAPPVPARKRAAAPADPAGSGRPGGRGMPLAAPVPADADAGPAAPRQRWRPPDLDPAPPEPPAPPIRPTGPAPLQFRTRGPQDRAPGGSTPPPRRRPRTTGP
ncbi:hypothetical protein CLV72_102406 [Allonocardiopsis opalescens]|uniref:TraM-binding TraD/TraG-like protein n=2 Tax=Allonocardiopsis opalescens TaxID=1144618 RepID=A0A2T0QA89_9ACTN|nr:hypothetical protein CLV72_102406 [Allonocardiopsis opalescens]